MKYYVFTKQELNKAINGWLRQEHPHATDRALQNHPDRKAVERLFQSRYITESRMERGQEHPGCEDVKVK